VPKQITKRSHWVSQSYLKGFAADPDTRQKIWRFSKNKGDPELKPIRKVAVKFYLYAPTAPSGGHRDDWLEKKLAELEEWFGGPVWAAVCTDFPDLSWTPLRKMLALLVATTLLRNPLQFERSKEVHQQLANFVSSSLARSDLPPEEWTPGYADFASA
jgi:hypothetical protein